MQCTYNISNWIFNNWDEKKDIHAQLTEGQRREEELDYRDDASIIKLIMSPKFEIKITSDKKTLE